MRADTKHKIIEVLKKRPQTRDQIATITNLSRATIVNAIRELRLQKVPDTRPAYYTLPLEAEMPALAPVELSPTSRATGALVIGYRQYPEWVDRWNGVAENFGKQLASIKITHKDNPKQLLTEFTHAAETLASLAYSIQKVSGKPDWYALLGGELEPEK